MIGQGGRVSLCAGLHRISLGLLLFLSAQALSAQATPSPSADPITAAVEHPARASRDLDRDAQSRPAAVLRFLAVGPGMTVFDLLGGDGYYSELLARVVGPTGRVYLHNNQGYAGLMRRIPERLARPDTEALEVYVREIADINLPSESVDLVLMVKVYHDLYYLNNGWAVSPDTVFTTMHRILKADGLLVVIDHRAPPGTGASYAQNLHRIDPGFAREDIEARGFRFAGESRVLENPDDDLDRSVFEPDLRGRTDRFLHRYRKVSASNGQ